VFVEKPLAVDHDGLASIRAAWNDAARGGQPCLSVGFNRRFSPHVQRLRQLLGTVPGPKALIMTVNAGRLPAEHWINDPAQGGGRLVGEGCHFIDLLRHLAGAPIADIMATSLGDRREGTPQSFTVTLRFVDGSMGTLHYLSNGHRRFSKEQLEVFVGGRVLILENFRRLRGFGWPHFKGMRTRRQDKGHRQLVEAFLDAAQGRGPLPIPIEEVFEVSDAVLRARDQVGR
jgi:predicted dehydrogenase